MNRKMLRSLIHWIFMAFAHLGCEAGVLSAEQLKYLPGGSDIAVLRDTTGTLSVEDLERPDLAARFVPVNGLLGYEKEVVWLRLRLQRQESAPQTWFLEWGNPLINDLRLYSQSASGFTVAQAGNQFAFADRALKFRFPAFSLAFPDARQQTFYLRLESHSSLAGELLVWQPDALRDKAQQENFYFGAVLGMICMSFLISVIYGASTRDRRFLFFTILTFNSLLLVATGLGFFAQFLAPTMPLLVDLMVPWSLAFNTVLLVLVFGHALNIYADFPRLGQFLMLASGLALAAPLTRFFKLYNVWGGPLLQLVSLLVVLCTGGLSWIRWRSNARGAGYFFAAHVILIGSMLTGRLIFMGWLPANDLTQLSWIPGLAIYIFLVHVGIFIDSQSVKSERDVALGEIQADKLVLVNERKLREEQTVFFSFVAHELRSPLAASVTGVRNLEHVLTDAQQEALARTRRIKGYGERMSSLIDRHLTLQRLANADFLPQLAPADPRQIAEQGLQHVRALFVDCVIETDYSEGVPTLVFLDQNLLLMGLENLLTNAAKYGPERVAIALEIFADTALHFRVSDRGLGIHPEHRARLFSIFNRMQQSDFKGGFGIGLAIVQRVAHAHGGSLKYADRPGGGAVFTLTLPLSSDTPGNLA